MHEIETSFSVTCSRSIVPRVYRAGIASIDLTTRLHDVPRLRRLRLSWPSASHGRSTRLPCSTSTRGKERTRPGTVSIVRLVSPHRPRYAINSRNLQIRGQTFPTPILRTASTVPAWIHAPFSSSRARRFKRVHERVHMYIYTVSEKRLCVPPPAHASLERANYSLKTTPTTPPSFSYDHWAICRSKLLIGHATVILNCVSTLK